MSVRARVLARRTAPAIDGWPDRRCTAVATAPRLGSLERRIRGTAGAVQPLASVGCRDDGGVRDEPEAAVDHQVQVGSVAVFEAGNSDGSPVHELPAQALSGRCASVSLFSVASPG
ncbi:hypothetical protein GCM10010230_25430 [Streptomyces narbonensis]|nr:hypothetical protein GCM10010230_25430 [Streptomyces narbonensis]